METVNIHENFGTDHPAFGTSNGWYLFAFTNGSSIRRLALVEAKNKWAIMTMEFILRKSGHVSGTCHVISIFRNCDNIGLRSDEIDEIDYVDFMIDVVDSSLILANVATATMFRNSISKAECEYVSEKLSLISSKRMDDDFEQTMKTSGLPVDKTDSVKEADDQVDNPISTDSKPKNDANAEKLCIALIGLGYNKKVVRKYVSELSNTESKPIVSLVKEALVTLNA